MDSLARQYSLLATTRLAAAIITNKIEIRHMFPKPFPHSKDITRIMRVPIPMLKCMNAEPEIMCAYKLPRPAASI